MGAGAGRVTGGTGAGGAGDATTASGGVAATGGASASTAVGVGGASVPQAASRTASAANSSQRNAAMSLGACFMRRKVVAYSRLQVYRSGKASAARLASPFARMRRKPMQGLQRTPPRVAWRVTLCTRCAGVGPPPPGAGQTAAAPLA